MQILFENSCIKINIDELDITLHLPKFTIWSKEIGLKYKAHFLKKDVILIRENLKFKKCVLIQEVSILISN